MSNTTKAPHAEVMTIAWTGKCTRCKTFLTEETRYAETLRPHCRTCFLIVFYQYPEAKLKKVEAEIAKHRARGVDEDTLDKLFMSALRQHADKTIREKLSGFRLPVRNPRAETMKERA